MTLLQMRYFQSVFEYQSISRTADALNVSQPTISKAIQTLEWELGIPLFSRNKKHIEPTEAGRFLYEESKRIILLYDKLMSDLQGFHSRNTLVNIGIGSMSNIVLTEWIHQVSTQAKGISLHLTEMNHGRNMEKMRASEIDFFVDGDNSNDILNYPSYGHIVLAHQNLMFCVNKASPLANYSSVSPNQIGDYPIVVLDSDASRNTLPARIFAAEQLKPNIVLQTNQMNAIDSLIKNNLAGVFLFDSIIPDKPYFHSIPLAPERPVEIRLVWNKNNLSPPASIFLEIAKKLTNILTLQP